MHKIVVTATATVRTLGSTDFDFAVALRHTVNATRLSYTHQLRLVRVVSLAQLVQHFDRVSLDHTVEHILDFVRASTLMRDDERVQANLMDELQPSHVKL